MSNASTCSAVDCGRPVEARSLCKKHYMRLRRSGAASPVPSKRDDWFARFLRNFDDSAGVDGCWPWTAHTQDGYGVLGVNGQKWTAHRLSYALHFGDLPESLSVCHHCDNPPCVNPSHLYMGTVAENARDMVERERTRSSLTATQVREIRMLHASGGGSMAAISRRFGVSIGTVFNVVHRKTWSHVA